MPGAAPAQPKADAMVPVRRADGQVGSVPQSDLAKEIDAGGEVVTQAEVRKAELQAKYGDFAGGAASFGAGVGRGLTFGLSDAAAVAVGGKGAQQWLQEHQEANPTASMAGEVAGAIAPIIASGGSGAAAKGVATVGVLPRGVAAAGRIAESGAASLIGRGATSLAGKVAQRAIPAAIGAGVEGAAYGVGHEISDTAINDHELTAEKLLAGAGKGALYGALLGGATSATGTLLAEGGKAVSNRVLRTLKGGSVDEVLDRMSGEAAFRSAGGGKAIAKSADKFGGGYTEVGKIWRDEAPALVGKRNFARMTQEDMVEAANKGLQKHGAELGESLQKLDDVAMKSGKLPLAKDVIGDVDSVISTLKTRAGTEPAVAKLQQFSDSAKRVLGMTDEAGQLLPDAADKTLSFTQLHQLRQDADAAWRGTKFDPSLTGWRAEFGKVRDNLEQRLMREGDVAAKEAGELFRKGYEQAKQRYQAFKYLATAAENGAASGGSNRFFGLSEQIGGFAGSNAGALIGGPVGSVLGAGVGSLASHVIKSRGDFWAAEALGHLAKLSAVERMAAQVDAKVATGVKGFLSTAARTTGISAGESAMSRVQRKQIAAQQAEALATMKAAGPVAAMSAVQQVIGNQLPDAAPGVTQAMAVKAMAALGKSAEMAPSLRKNATSLSSFAEPHRVSDTELAKFQKYLEGATDPLSVLDDMKHGRLSHEKAMAVRDNYPKLFQQIADKIMNDVAESGRKVPYSVKSQASILFGVPLDDTLTPSFVRAIQQSKQAPPPPANAGAPPPAEGAKRPINLDSEQLQTDSQHVEAVQ